MIDLTENKHIQALNHLNLPSYSIGEIVNTPLGFGIVVKTPSIKFDGLQLIQVIGSYKVYFGINDEDKLNQIFIDDENNSSEDRHVASRWISNDFDEKDLSPAPDDLYTKKSLLEYDEFCKEKETINNSAI